MREKHWTEYEYEQDDSYVFAEDTTQEYSFEDLVTNAFSDEPYNPEKVLVLRGLDDACHRERREHMVSLWASSMVETLGEWFWDEWGCEDYDAADDALVAHQSHLAKCLEGPIYAAVRVYGKHRRLAAIQLELDEEWWVQHTDKDTAQEYIDEEGKDEFLIRIANKVLAKEVA